MPNAEDKLTLFDACAVINFCATGHLTEIVDCIDGRAGIASIVEQESLYIAGPDEPHERELIDLSGIIVAGAIEVLTLDSDAERYSFLDFAVDLDDGEAMTLALAVHRDAAVITDDRKAIRIASEIIETVSSLEVIKRWFELEKIGDGRQRNVLRAIQARASYVPGRNHPLHEWWDRVLRQN